MRSTSHSNGGPHASASASASASTSGKQRLDEEDSSSSVFGSEDGDEDGPEEEAWEDWVDDDQDVDRAPTRSLFDTDDDAAKLLPGPEAALAHDRDHYGCDLVAVVARLCAYAGRDLVNPGSTNG